MELQIELDANLKALIFSVGKGELDARPGRFGKMAPREICTSIVQIF